MPLSIPALVSPVGVNTQIVDHEKNGFYCRNHEEWETAISRLINDRELLQTLSSKTAKKVVDDYSVRSNTQNFLNLFS